MTLKHYNPTTPGQRQLILVSKEDLWKGKPVKSLTEGLCKTGGRNHHGHITTRHIGGGHKRLYRFIDFKRLKDDVSATVKRFEYDPNRTAFIACIQYEDGEISYILAPQRLAVGDQVISGENVDIKVGNALPLKKIPIGTIIHNIEMKARKGGQISRSAGTYSQIIGRDSGYVQIRLFSGELRMIHGECRASIGAVSNPDQKNISLSKAGRSRWLGIRPTVRGIAMNPVDHPHGGNSNGGCHPQTPWGISTKGKKTRVKKPSDQYIISRRKK